MQFTIDAASPHAPYEQLRREVLEAVRSGALIAGAKLPTVRHLAEELGIAPNTVARTYRELEHDGVIETRGRNGSYIAASGDITMQQAQLAARAYVDRIHQLGLSDEAALGLARSALEQ